MTIPYAYCLTRGLALLEHCAGGPSVLGRAACTALGLLSVCLFPRLAGRPLALCATSLGLLVIDLPRCSRAGLRSLVGSVAVVVVGYGTVWNLNYLFAPTSPASLHDPAILHLDRILYGWLLSAPVDYRALFPLFTSRAVFAVLENAYQMLFVELFVVILVLRWRRKDVGEFVRTVFLCYFVGLLVFFLYPVVGPCIAYPESFQPAYHATRTYQLMQAMAGEFAALRDRVAVNGLAYFVALPSLHVALAVIFQSFLAASWCHFWAFLPVNVLMVASTVLLGYHYLVDLPAGVLVAAAALWVVRRPQRSTEPHIATSKSRQVPLAAHAP